MLQVQTDIFYNNVQAKNLLEEKQNVPTTTKCS